MLNAFFYNLVPAYFDEIREQKQINARYRRKRILEATLSLHSIGQSVFELESGNENVDQQTDGRQTHQSNRQVGYTQPT